jgi:protein-L-isoaspartate(D-aspartate) O-methyltransferase
MSEDSFEMNPIQKADILRAMQAVPRHLFVPPEYRDQAHKNQPLPIGFDQTISQPSLVAYMIDLLDLRAGDKVLEIGTGSGYQTAILAELGVVDVYSVEIIPELAEQAAERLRRLGYANVHLKVGNGYYGWAESAPFDAIILAAASKRMPPLAEQLVEGGRMVVPIGPRWWDQALRKYVKQGAQLKASTKGWVAFVPLQGEEAHRSSPSQAIRQLVNQLTWKMANRRHHGNH